MSDQCLLPVARPHWALGPVVNPHLLSIRWSLIVHDRYLSSGEDGYSWALPLMTVMYSFDGTSQKPSHSCYLRVMGNNSYRVQVFISPSGDGC